MKLKHTPTLLLFLFLTLITSTLFAQNKYTISGYLKDMTNGESIFAANVYVKEILKGTTTNEYGFYSITLEEGNYILVFSYIGYEPKEYEVSLTEDIRLNVEIGSKAVTKEEITITAEREDQNVSGTDMGRVELSTDQVKALPALLGEVDIMRTIQLLPGIQSAGEGNSGFYVRGGGPDQNLILLDNAVVYNTGHLFGFFSVFNADAIKNTTIIKGGMPANYGGRLSSVLDISMKEGNMKKYQVEGGIGLISSRLTVQGPIKKESSSFIVSARRTYIDILAKPFLKNFKDGEFAGNSYYFYDINAKINYRFGDRDRLYLSGYFGRDVFNFSSPDGTFNFSFPWGNATTTLRWNHLFSDKIFMNAMAIYNDYNFKVSSGFQDVSFKLNSGVRDFGGKVDFDYFPVISHNIKFGVNYTYHIFTPYTATGQAGEVEFNTDDISKKYAHESSIYILDDFDVVDWLKVNVGLRASMFNHVGPLDKTVFDEFGQAEDTLHFDRGEHIASYGGIEPRISLRFKIDQTSSVKTGFSVNRQYIHLVSSSTSTLPTDLWVPSTALVKPQVAYQYSVGYFKNFKSDLIETSVELYYKDLFNQIEYGESFSPELDADLEDSFVFGRGRSYGAEFFVKKTKGKWNGWIGYTLSFTDRTFDDLNNGEPFPAKYDRRHDLSIVGMYEINDKWRIASTFVYGTGQATTVPIGRYFIEGEVRNIYGERNDFRLAPYHRLDLSAIYIIKDEKRYSDIALSIYNVYNRKNPYFIYWDVDGTVESGDLSVKAMQASLFPILPSITWNFKF